MSLSLLATVSIGVALQVGAAGRTLPPRVLTDVRDSVSALRRARKAQNEFESVRRMNSPRTFDRAPSPCGVQRIGRFCYWYGDTAETRAPKEARQIVKARGKLLATLSTSANLIAGDDWIAGQRTRYLVEAGDTAGALAVARDCQATHWWCAALLGFARHAARDYAGADDAYARALAAMPERERCLWTDLAPLLDDATRRHYSRIRCAERGAENARLWWLADPFHVIPGNDRRTEHYARLTMARMHRDAWNAHAIAWGEDFRELMVRYGWSTWWTRAEAPLHAPMNTPVIGNGRTPAYHFLPEGRIAADPSEAAGTAWPIDGLLGNGATAREYYAPAYAISVSPVRHDAQRFRRGDSALLVVTYDASDDGKLAGKSFDVALALSASEQDAPIVRRHDGTASAGLLVSSAPWKSMLLSLELLARDGERAARARNWVGDRDIEGESAGLLLLEPGSPLPSSLDEAVPRARISNRILRGERLALFWESYDLSAGDTLVVSIGVTRERGGVLRRAAQSLRLAKSWTPVSLAWRESVAESRAIFPRSVELDLSSLGTGKYRIELTVTRIGGSTARAGRDIEILDAPRSGETGGR